MAKLEDLKELAKGVNKNKVKQIQILGANSQSETIFDNFYQALLDDRFETDEEYAAFFYDNPKSKAFYKLKERLEERLINTVFFVDINKKNQTAIQKAYYTCYKNLSAIRILIGKSIRKSSISLAKKTIKKSIEYGFSDVTFELARILKTHYSTFEADVKKFEYYRKISTTFSEILSEENDIEDFSALIVLEHNNRTILKKEREEFFKGKYLETKLIMGKHYSYKLSNYGFFYRFLYLELTCNWKKLVEEYQNFIDYHKMHLKPVSSFQKGNFMKRKVTGLFMLKQYDLAEKIAYEALSQFPEGTHNWFYVQEYILRIQYFTKKFSQLDRIIEIVYAFKKSFHFNRWEENFKIHEALISYLKLIGKIKPDKTVNNEIKKFRFGKFLNEVPNHSKDKKGSNITILILQILFLLEDRKYDVLIDKAEALKIYTQRYLKGDGTFRSNCFIKMLLSLPAGNFERAQVEQKAQKHLDHLLSMPIEKARQSAELEIMPYEMLWEFVLESLERNT